jgi:hypothetical protein
VFFCNLAFAKVKFGSRSVHLMVMVNKVTSVGLDQSKTFYFQSIELFRNFEFKVKKREIE